MQLFSQYTLGIDIKNDYAAVVCLQSRAKGYNLIGHEVFALDSEVPLTESVSRLGRLIHSFVTEHKLYEPDVLVSVPGDRIITREITFPLSVKENLRETMRYEVEKYVPFSVNDIYFDCQITVQDKKTNTLCVLLVVAQKEDLDPYLALQTEVGVMGSVETASTILAYGAGLGSDLEWRNGSGFLLNIENGRLRCNLVKDSRLLSSQLLPSTNTHNLSEPVLKEMCDSLLTNHSMPLTTEPIYCVDERGSGVFDVQVEGDVRLEPLPIPDTLPSANLLLAYFLALKGQRKPENQINLLPKNIRKKPSSAPTYIAVALTVLVLLLSIGLGGNFFFQKKMVYKRLTDEVTRLNREVDGLHRLEADITLLQNRISFLAETDMQTTVMLDIVSELSQLLPDEAWIQKFSFANNSVRIDGSAKSATVLIEQLEPSYLFQDVSFLTPVRKGADGKEIFTIGFVVSSSE